MSELGFAIYVGEDVYFAASYSFDTEGKKLDGSGVDLLVFRPRNGLDRGKVHKIPIANVSHIVDRSS